MNWLDKAYWYGAVIAACSFMFWVLFIATFIVPIPWSYLTLIGAGLCVVIAFEASKRFQEMQSLAQKIWSEMAYDEGPAAEELRQWLTKHWQMEASAFAREFEVEVRRVLSKSYQQGWDARRRSDAAMDELSRINQELGID